MVALIVWLLADTCCANFVKAPFFLDSRSADHEKESSCTVSATLDADIADECLNGWLSAQQNVFICDLPVQVRKPVLTFCKFIPAK